MAQHARNAEGQDGPRWGISDRAAALAAVWLAVSWAVSHFYDFYVLRHWWTLPIFLAGVVAAGMLIAGHRHGSRAALAAGVMASLAEHLWRNPVLQSDSLPIIRGALALLVAGQDPYGVPISTSIPPGALYAYPPGPFLVYGPIFAFTTDATNVERMSAMLIVLVIAALAGRVGPGRAALASTLYGTFLYGSFRALDSSTETTLALLVVAGTVLLDRGIGGDRRAFWAAVPVFALALLFKQSAWPVYLFVAFFLWTRIADGRRHVTSTVALAAAVMAPFFLWGPIAFVPSVLMRPIAHENVYGFNVLGALAMVQPALAEALSPYATFVQFAGLAVTVALFLRRPPRDLAGALARGAGTVFVAMVLDRWTSPSYFMYLGALLALLVAIAPLSKTLADRLVIVPAARECERA